MVIKTDGKTIETTPRVEKVISFIFSRIEPSAHVYLIGSRARGNHTAKSDWDFAINAGVPLQWNFFASLRQDAADIAFPDKIDIIDLNRAPVWFLKSVSNDLVEIVR
ncbi:MAG TPA: nucleotidyltransferase domain-containing protein [Chitinispirillaceae bacterium]|nr:nucleotidyltransferase domain-containing protein [Chitinispirillaceae bacterium]